MTEQSEMFPKEKPWWKCGDRPQFDGAVYETRKDQVRLTGQLAAICALMQDGIWRTLAEIEAATDAPQASISAQLRNLRKRRFGSHAIAKRRRSAGLWEYRVAS